MTRDDARPEERRGRKSSPTPAQLIAASVAVLAVYAALRLWRELHWSVDALFRIASMACASAAGIMIGERRRASRGGGKGRH